jgi:hypothetical protein
MDQGHPQGFQKGLVPSDFSHGFPFKVVSITAKNISNIFG